VEGYCSKVLKSVGLCILTIFIKEAQMSKIKNTFMLISVLSFAVLGVDESSGGSRSATVETGSGKTGSYTGSTVRNGSGSVTNTGSVTGPGGTTKSRSATTTVNPGTGTATHEVTSPTGNTRTTTVDVQ
jgi:hypothetical protein